MRIRALPISEWSAGEVCGHVCSRGSRGRRVSGICVVSTLAVCVRSSLNAGPVDVSGRRWSATNGSRWFLAGRIPSTRTRRGPAQQHRGVSVASQLSCAAASGKPVPATGHHRYTENRSHESAQRRSMAGEASGTDIQLGPDGRREGAISRGSNFGLCEGVKRGRKADPVFLFYYVKAGFAEGKSVSSLLYFGLDVWYLYNI